MKQRDYLLRLPDCTKEQVLESWLRHPFFETSLVLGIDIGLEGIGLYLRKGKEELFAQTVDLGTVLPAKSDALEKRRQARHARRCRTNRNVRLRRLDALLEKHGLPLQWREKPEAFQASDPFKLRYRAVREDGAGLDSKYALANAIRHCVQHRGYDYGRFMEEGGAPWGTSPKLAKAIDWLKTASIDDKTAEELSEIAKNRNLEVREGDADKRWAEFSERLAERIAFTKKHDIASVLEAHAKGDKHDNLRTRARGFAFPRAKVWEHLEFIVRRHAHLIDDAEGFLCALGIQPDDRSLYPDLPSSAAAREQAIFWYNRKTIFEMERHWQRKRKDCPFASRLGFVEQKTSPRSDRALRLWSLAEFALTRRVEITFKDDSASKTEKEQGQRTKAAPAKKRLHSLSPEAVRKLVAIVDAQHAEDGAVRPTTGEERSAVTAQARSIIEGDIEKNSGVDLKLKPKPAPQKSGKEELWNASFFEQLHDIVAPVPSALQGTGSLSHEAAARLYSIATDEGKDFTKEGFNQRLTDLGFYDWRRESVLDWGVYPQVEFLLGRRIKNSKRKGQLSVSCQGFLRQLIGRLVEEGKLPRGTSAPDYCIVEVIGNAPRNDKEKGDILAEQRKNRTTRDEAFVKLGYNDSGVASRRRRIALHAQQRGRSPYTQARLPDDPLSEDLEIEHVFPASRGGLSVDDNLVLTYKTENAAKGNSTPLEWLGKEDLQRQIEANKDMKWSAMKREVFAWGTREEDDPSGKWPSHYNNNHMLLIPDFGNTTRTAQLARQLRAAVAHWMGIEKDPEAMALHIGTPSGWLANKALRTWLPDYRKDRSDLTHHLVDAAVLSHIPPREGMNSVYCGGIFYDERQEVPDNYKPGHTTTRLVTNALPGLFTAERIAKWLPNGNKEYTECPVYRHRPRNNKQSIGDSTFWRLADPNKPDLAQREKDCFNPADYDGDADKLLGELKRMQINERKHRQWSARNKRKGLPAPTPRDVLPTLKDIEDYLEKATATTKAERGQPFPVLRLRDGKDGAKGTPITKVWKWSTKRNLSSPLGLSGSARKEDGKLVFESLRLLKESYDRLEIWLGYDPRSAQKAKKAKQADWQEKGWHYYRRLIPNATALRHLKQLGFEFSRDKKEKAPACAQDKPGVPETHQSLREIVLGDKLPPFSKKVGQFRKGDVLLLGLDAEGAIAGKGETIKWSAHFTVTSLSGSFALEMKPLLFKDKSATPFKDSARKQLTQNAKDSEVHASLLDLPSAPALAAKFIEMGKMRIPDESA